jgi:3-oxoacyl-[acyl-carrier-protein] synthase-1
LLQIQEIFYLRRADYAVLVGVDSLMTAGTLDHFHKQRRLLTAHNSDGFLPGEAAAALLLAQLPQFGGICDPCAEL